MTVFLHSFISKIKSRLFLTIKPSQLATFKFFSRIKFPHIKWPQFIGYTLAIALLIPALLGIYAVFYPEDEQEEKLRFQVLSMPFSFEPHQKLGDYYAKQGKIKEAAREYKLSYSLGNRDILESYKEITTLKKRIREEIKFWEKVLREKPDYRDAMVKLASLYYQTGEIQKAKELAGKAKSVDPNYPPLANLLLKIEQSSPPSQTGAF